MHACPLAAYRPRYRLRRSALIAALLLSTGSAWAASDDDDGPAKPLTELIVTAKRLDAARANIDVGLGASSYLLTNDTFENRPGSESTSIGRILLQAPGVQQDGSGQTRIRQSQGAVQYRINNIALPDGLSDIGESLSARLVQQVELVTGALPAQYGYQAGGVVNLTTKNGAYLDGGQIELYGGGHGAIEPALEYGSNLGPTNFFVSGSFQANRVGLPSPDGSAVPAHDRATQYDLFAFLDRILDDNSRIAMVAGASDDRFRVPNLRGTESATLAMDGAPFRHPLSTRGLDTFASDALDDRRREATRFVVTSLMRATDELAVQAAVFLRDSVRSRRADGVGDLLFTGLAIDDRERLDEVGGQAEAAWDLGGHTLRGGLQGSFGGRRTATRSTVLPLDADGVQLSETPREMLERSRLIRRRAGAFAQDEWRIVEDVTINTGIRFDEVRRPGQNQAASPRASVVWSVPDGPVLHFGYARYFLPRPLDDSGESPTEFSRTSAASPTPTGDRPMAETDHYFDVGAQWTLGGLTAGVDAYWRRARNLIADGEFGLAHQERHFNYAAARLRGVEATTTYAAGALTAWANLAVARATGRTIASNQYYFTAAQLRDVAARFTALGTDQRVTASAGASYRFGRLFVSADAIYGSGLPATRPGNPSNATHLPGALQANLAFRYLWEWAANWPLGLRFDIFNLFDARYALRDGTSLGGGMPQWGQRRVFYVGFEQSF